MTDYLKIVYSEKKRPFTDYPPKLIKYLYDKFDLEPGMKILEPGPGRGEFLKSFKDLGLDVVGMDISDGSSDYFLKEEMELIISDIENEKGLPFPNESFDVIFNKSLLEHLYKPDLFLREANRILKPNGKIICLVPDWESNFKTYFDDFTHRTPFTTISLRDAYKMHQFKKVKVFKFRQLPILWRFPILNYLSMFIAPFVPRRTKIKFLRWSRELMLIGVGEK